MYQTMLTDQQKNKNRHTVEVEAGYTPHSLSKLKFKTCILEVSFFAKVPVPPRQFAAV